MIEKLALARALRAGRWRRERRHGGGPSGPHRRTPHDLELLRQLYREPNDVKR